MTFSPRAAGRRKSLHEIVYNFTPNTRLTINEKSLFSAAIKPPRSGPLETVLRLTLKEIPDEGVRHKVKFYWTLKLMIFFTKFTVFIVFRGVFLIEI